MSSSISKKDTFLENKRGEFLNAFYPEKDMLFVGYRKQLIKKYLSIFNVK